jgi:predicted phosphodiesterase
MHLNTDRLIQINNDVEAHGIIAAAQKHNLAVDSVRRYLAWMRKQDQHQPPRNSNSNSKKHDKQPDLHGSLKIIAEIYSEDELKAIAKGGRILPGIEPVPIISFEGERIRIGAITDTHIGHKKFSEKRLYQVFDEFHKEKVEFITHCGDVTEGMSHRAGHVYELDAIGYEAQKDLAIKIFSQWTDTPIYSIDGNHDRWYIKSNGAIVVKDIARALPNFVFLGHDEGDISLKGKATLKLWHGEDGNSYALSYRIQKIVESFTGGEKPSALFAGHTHKYVKMHERNVHAISVGCIESQTSWMRGKRIAAQPGFEIFDIWVNDRGIAKITETWYPFYN